MIDVDSMVYAAFRLSCLHGWSRRRLSVFLFLTVVTRGDTLIFAVVDLKKLTLLSL